MMTRPEKDLPFVILTDVRSGKFVQFCGSRERELTFDVPELQVTHPLGGASDPSVYGRAAALAFETLNGLIRDTPRGELHLEESIEHDPHSN